MNDCDQRVRPRLVADVGGPRLPVPVVLRSDVEAFMTAGSDQRDAAEALHLRLAHEVHVLPLTVDHRTECLVIGEWAVNVGGVVADVGEVRLLDADIADRPTVGVQAESVRGDAVDLADRIADLPGQLAEDGVGPGWRLLRLEDLNVGGRLCLLYTSDAADE